MLDLDGTLVDTAPDLNDGTQPCNEKVWVSNLKQLKRLRNLVGKGAGVLIGRSIWGQC